MTAHSPAPTLDPAASPPKSWTPDPDDTDGLGRRAARGLKFAMKVRRDATPRGEPPPSRVRITTRQAADVLGCHPGNALKTLHAAASEYPDLGFERVGHSAWELVYNFALKGTQWGRPASADKCARGAETSGREARTSPGPTPRKRRTKSAQGAHSLPMCSNSDVEEDVSLTLTPAPPAERERCAALPGDGGTVDPTPKPESTPPIPEPTPATESTPIETAEARAARVAAYMNTMPPAEVAAITAKVKADNPGLVKFPKMLESPILEAVAKTRRDLFPEVTAPASETGPSAESKSPPPPPDSKARRLLRVGEPTGPATVGKAVDGLKTLTGGEHMGAFFRRLLADTMPRPKLADQVAAIIDRAVHPSHKLPPWCNSPDHYVSKVVYDTLVEWGLRPAKSPRGRHAA